jgi:hypothetical protein
MSRIPHFVSAYHNGHFANPADCTDETVGNKLPKALGKPRPFPAVLRNNNIVSYENGDGMISCV